MLKKLGIFASIVATCGLLACNQADQIATPPGVGAEGTGSARIQLPTPPAGFLAKSAAGARAVFALTITGEGMSPIQRSWTLSGNASQSVSVDGIPAGRTRYFQGQLLRVDSSGWDSVVTHEGGDSAFIEKGRVTEVRLFLGTTQGGSAHICIEVEGWPSDSTCIGTPPPVYPGFGGCWKVAITKPGPTHADDSVFTGHLRINQWDSALSAFITWNSGRTDSSFGYIRGDGTALIGYGGGQFLLKADFYPSKVDTTNAMELTGWFNDSLRNIAGNLAGYRIPCDTFIEPPPDTLFPTDTLPRVDSAFSCWKVTQDLANGKGGSGTFWALRTGFALKGFFLWDGNPGMPVTNGLVPASPDAFYLYGNLPQGISGAPSGTADAVHYKAKIGSGGNTLFYGAIYKTDSAGNADADSLFGKWSGDRTTCSDRVMHFLRTGQFP